jgi:hypothetical protein
MGIIGHVPRNCMSWAFCPLVFRVASAIFRRVIRMGGLDQNVIGTPQNQRDQSSAKRNRE